MDELAERIASDIQSGALAAGMWLKQVDLETRYDCSRPAVRRALDKLAEKRLVQHVANRGYYVFAPDDAKTREILAIRVMLETGVADAIAATGETSALVILRELARRFEALIDTGTVLALYDVNLAFHRGVLRLGGNTELVNLVDELRRRTSSAPATQWQTRADLERSAQEHHEIVASIAARDGAALRAVLTRHILKP